MFSVDEAVEGKFQTALKMKNCHSGTDPGPQLFTGDLFGLSLSEI
jgi:hypothetical protein